MQEYEAKIAALARMVGRQALEIESLGVTTRFVQKLYVKDVRLLG
jgi:hypothetical protein